MNISDDSGCLESLKNSARDAPRLSGVYLWKNSEGQIIYIGKAKSLRDRLGSYFSGKKDPKTATLIRRAATIEYIIVSGEYEALLLENTLIKQHSPKYNISLKDGKTYPVIRITNEDFPRVFRTRRIIQDKSLYYGPFPDVRKVDVILDIIDKLFPLRKCKIFSSFKKRHVPCMYYHIKRCKAPCCGRITADEYFRHIEMVRQFLSGETGPLVTDLTIRMHEAARALQFELAAQIRNAIQAIEELAGENSAVVDFDPESRDYIAWASEGVLATFTVFSMRGGKMTGRELYRTRSAAGERETLEHFITTFYDSARPPPAKIFLGIRNQESEEGGSLPLAPALLNYGVEFCNAKLQKTNGGPAARSKSSATPSAGRSRPRNAPGDSSKEQDQEIIINNQSKLPTHQIENSKPVPYSPLSAPLLLQNWFREKFDFEPELLIPTEKHHSAALAMARQNAIEDLRKRLKERGAGPALDELARALGLSGRPERIEGFDIAQLDGKHPVASLVSFKNGTPDKKNYRYFKLRSVIGIVDDFASVREAVRRRYSRLIREGGDLPDLILIDGGIGQVNAAKGVIDDLGIALPVAGLAKREEEIWLPHAKEPLILPSTSEALKLLQFVRDETHRFATGFNQRLRSKDLSFPALESVEGIGKQRAAAIMKTYETLENIAEADPAKIAECCRISPVTAKAVRAAARLALEDRNASQSRLAGKAKRSAGRSVGESLAAEAEAVYDDTKKN